MTESGVLDALEQRPETDSVTEGSATPSPYPNGVPTKPFAVRLGSAGNIPLPDDCMDLTVTSPPYWNAIDYEVFCQSQGCKDRTVNWKRRPSPEEGESYQTYLGRMRACFTEVLRVTKTGGICAINVGHVLYRQRLHPIPHDLSVALRASGWRLRDEIVWHKVTAARRRAGSAIRYRSPMSFYPNIVHESVLIFQKPGDRALPTPEQRLRSRITIDEVFTRDTANSVWHIAPVRPRSLDHPCPFPLELPYRLIELYSYAGDLILDPFAGSGQTGVAARTLDRRFIGCDTQPAFVTLARAREHETYLRGPQHVIRWERAPVGNHGEDST